MKIILVLEDNACFSVVFFLKVKVIVLEAQVCLTS